MATTQSGLRRSSDSAGSTRSPLVEGCGQMRALVEVRPTARAKREIIAVCRARAAGREQVLR